ncbi:EP1-like glycoprotein 4 [Physcomitrium patens]|uniref:Apple domain-containing protein n=1 Tax=Physcomitrium patens TaxID=3218 RepID=A0A2K1K664_PHYPA|nr:EP1-like glycoprotein 4 [Physcomitrium patens]PNR49270.1 hypothetical protein PHYPA_011166 [Physcomitrium patens]|eukprot:XP_024382089.1 EP1-like glycoprotein 4 [Physcomitrella patens]
MPTAMPTPRGFRLGDSLIIVAICIFATGCLVHGAPPASRAKGYSAIVDLTLPVDSPARGKAVLETGRFQFWLEGDMKGVCSLSVREKYTGRGDPSNRPGDRGYLLWSANYYAGTPVGADKCTVKFTNNGDLQLWILYKGKTSLTWSSETGGKGVTKMALETNPDNGNFKLVTGYNKAIFNSFDVKEWLVLKGQKFWTGERLKNPKQEQDLYQEVLANKGTYIMILKGGDLQLLLNGPNPEVYWSLKKSVPVSQDLSKVAYAAVARNNDGIGLYTAAGSLVYKTAVPPWVPNYGADYDFGLDFQGNLKYYLMYKDASWTYGWQALFECDLPNFCGNYGICSTTTDQTGTTTAGCTGCPTGFSLNSPDHNSPPVCKRNKKVKKCNNKNYVELAGYESAMLFYATPLRISLGACKASCSADCNCDGFFYNGKAGNCFKRTQILTLKKVTVNTGTSVFIKV